MRIDLHMHTLLSDGELLPIELARRCVVKGHKVIATTDHVSLSTLDRVLEEAARDIPLAREWGLEVLNGVEVTHVPARKIDMVVSKARKLGAQIVVIHGETISEPVEKGTNYASVSNPEIDILAHPGFITLEEAELAKRNNVALEITSRSSHNKTNGHVVRMAREAGAKMVLNSDTHAPGDIIDEQTAMIIAQAAGMTPEEAHRACYDTPAEIVKRRSIS